MFWPPPLIVGLGSAGLASTGLASTGLASTGLEGAGAGRDGPPAGPAGADGRVQAQQDARRHRHRD